MTNHLANSVSPYLLQHAHNPVDWYPWGEEALHKARLEDKPIFLSIGYAACHWCHVMAHESFEDPETAALLNQHFVSIKVDREERPDLDGIYMAVVTSLTGSGGWPMSVFLSPDLQPFYGGTYFPAAASHGLPAFKDLLQALSKAWLAQRDEITRTGREIAAGLAAQSGVPEGGGSFTATTLSAAASALVETYDWEHGGWGPAPKFPAPMTVEFLLRRHQAGDPAALRPALHALQAMARGGMYDLVGGGFCRYSTDSEWRVPHFEKMLPDNAQLARAYLHAWQVTGEPFYRRVVEATLKFVTRELASAQGGFHSSLDADLEGGEGRFYTWTLEQVRQELGGDSEFFETACAIPAAGNWEGGTVLQRAVDDASLAARFGLTLEQVAAELDGCHSRLLEARSRRARPATDDKVLCSWNGLMLAAFADAARVFRSAEYLIIARRSAAFLLTHLRSEGQLRHAFRAGQTGKEVFLEDYAALILGLLELYQADFDNRWFVEACKLAGEMLERFSDPAGGFFDTPTGAELVLIRPKELQDNAVPSGNAMAAEALLRLDALTGSAGWRQAAEKSLSLVGAACSRHPNAFGRWLSAGDFALGRVRQVAVIGNPGDVRTAALMADLHQPFHPNLVLASSGYPPPPGAPSLLADRPLVDGSPTAYVCEGFVCRLPVTRSAELAALLQAD